ncbi:MAG: hypothetical protein ACTSX8_05065 [Alphaproteobacteria bacterium]
MSEENQETQEVADITLPLIPEDGGYVEAARYRVGLAMLLTMLAEMAEDVGPVKVQMFHDLATNLIQGNEPGLRLLNNHSFRMKSVRFELLEDEEGSDDDA